MSRCKCVQTHKKKSDGPSGSASFGLRRLRKGLLSGLKKRLGEGEGSDNFLSSGAGASLHLKVGQSFPVLATLAHPQLGQALVQTSQKNTSLADLQVKQLQNLMDLVLHLLTGNVAALDTSSLVRTPCFCFITNCQLEEEF